MKVVSNNDPLAALVCGFEHSGTTLVTEILRKHPKFQGGFEGGFLLNEEAIYFLNTEPYCTNLKNGWGISDQDLQYICNAETWRNVYVRLKERSFVSKDINVKVFDKTPLYMKYLSGVLEKVPNVPCIVMVRDFRAIFWSSYKRTQLEIQNWYETVFPTTCEHVMSYAKGWQNAIDSGLDERILLLQYEKLCLDPIGEVKKICDFLGVGFDQSLLSFGADKHPFVYEDYISKQYLNEYNDRLPAEICEKIIDAMEEFKDWLW